MAKRLPPGITRDSRMFNAEGKPAFIVAYYDLNGVRRKKRTNACTLEDAQRILRDIEGDIDKAKVFKLSSVDQLEAMSFGHYVETKLLADWGIENIAKEGEEADFKVTKDVDEIDRSTANRYLGSYRTVKDTFGKVNLRNITLATVKDWRSKRRRTVSEKTGRLPENGTINRDVDFIRMVLRSAVPDYIPFNPIVYTKGQTGPKSFPKLTERPRKQKASDAQWGQLLSKAGDRVGGILKSFLIVAYESLLRPGDVLRLKTEDLLWEQGLLKVGEESKTARHTGESYAVFTPRAQEAVKALLKERGIRSSYLFVNPDTGKPYTVWTLSHAFAKLADEIGAPELQLRDLRRTTGTYLGQHVAGPLVSKALGHTTGAMLKHYVAIDASALSEVSRVLALRPEPKLEVAGERLANE